MAQRLGGCFLAFVVFLAIASTMLNRRHFMGMLAAAPAAAQLPHLERRGAPQRVLGGGLQPVTRKELLEALEATKKGILDAVVELVRDAQTEILKAFLPYQESSNVRLRVIETKLSNTEIALNGRVAIVERRLGEIKNKLLLNPPAA